VLQGWRPSPVNYIAGGGAVIALLNPTREVLSHAVNNSRANVLCGRS
jgi:hypothetical protein